jgi:DNA-binding XRE family transcriptional regulator
LPTIHPLHLTAAPLTQVLYQLALDIAQAQAALDLEAENQAQSAVNRDSYLPTIAFCFSDIELELSLAFTIAKSASQTMLAVTPANVSSNSFFRATSFGSTLRAKIAPRSLLIPKETVEEDSNA